MGMGLVYIFFSLVHLQSEGLSELQANLQSREVVWEQKLEKSQQAHEVWTNADFLSRLRDLKALTAQILSRQDDPEWVEQAIPALEESFANFSCRYVFKEGDEVLIASMNRLHAISHGNEEDLKQWTSILRMTQQLRSEVKLEDLQGSENVELVAWAADQFYIDVSNLLFHNSSRLCVRPENRAPKSLRELFQYSSGFRAPREKFYTLQYSVEHLEASLYRKNLFESFENLKAYISEELGLLSEVSQKHRSNSISLGRVRERLKNASVYRLQVSDLKANPSLVSGGFYLRIDLVAEVYDASGSSFDIYLPLARTTAFAEFEEFQEGNLEFSSVQLLEALEKISNFDLIQLYVRLGFRSLDSNSERAYLDLGFRRRLEQPLLGLQILPRYFPLGYQYEALEVSKATDIGHSQSDNIQRERILFLESLPQVPVAYDELIVPHPEGAGVYKIPILDQGALDRHQKIARSFHVAEPGQNLVDLKYDRLSEILLQMKVSLKFETL